MGLADTAMLGHLDHSRYLAAATLGTNVVALCYWMFAFLRMSTTSATAQGIGSQNTQYATLQLSANIRLAISGAFFLIAVQYLLLPQAMDLISKDSHLRELALSYCHIRIYSAPAVLLNFVAMGWLIGSKRTRTALLITVSANVLNVVLDYLFIVVLDWHVKGAAIATLLAEYSACLWAGWVIVHGLHGQPFSHVLKQHIPKDIWKKTFSVNADLFLRTFAILFTFNFFHAQGARFGEETLAANAIIMQWVLFTAFFLDGYALAAEAMTANAIGARKLSEFHRASAATVFSSAVIALLLTLIFALFSPWVLPLFTSIESLQLLVKEYVVWLFLIPIVNVWCYAFDGIFVGAGKTKHMRNHMAAALLLVFLPAWWFFQPLQNHGLWLAFVLFNGFRGFSLACAYWSITRHRSWL